MTNEELAVRIQQGERDKLPELWGQVEKFVSMSAGKRVRTLGRCSIVSEDDLINSGYIALVSAADTFDQTRGKQFIGWFAYFLRTAFLDAAGYRTKCQKTDPLHHAVSLDAPFGEDADGGTLSDLVPDPSDAFEETERKVFLEQLHNELSKALDTLPDNERTAIVRRRYDKAELKTIGMELGASPEHVRQIESQGFKKLRHPRISRHLEPFVEWQTNYFLHVGVDRFHNTGLSAVEEIAIQREAIYTKHTPGD
jgi:RNA polymerase sigma factor (sigma-70 family)